MYATTTLDKVLYTATTHTTGGRDGASRSLDGRLDVRLSTPGGKGDGTNPEQLFAADWATASPVKLPATATQATNMKRRSEPAESCMEISLIEWGMRDVGRTAAS